MKTDPWVTWWSHAQRGCGLINQQQPTHQCVNIHRLPEASAIRFRFSNFYDTQDVEITNVTLTYHDQEFPITFQKASTYILHQDETILSDPVDIHCMAKDTLILDYDIITQQACTSGIDVSNDQDIQTDGVVIYLFHGIDIISKDIKGCICVFGDSIVEMAQWTNVLKEMLKEKGYVLINQGISGNRLLKDLQHIQMDASHAYILEGTTAQQKIEEPKIFQHIPITKQCFGKPGIKRLKQEILDTHNHMKAIICAIGINDLYQPGTFCAELLELPTLEEMQQAYTNIWQQIKDSECDLLVVGITSFLASDGASTEKEMMRLALNEWMKQSTLPDGFVAFDDILCDTNHVLFDDVHIGDHLHPNAYGGKKMANKIYQQLEKLL